MRLIDFDAAAEYVKALPANTKINNEPYYSKKEVLRILLNQPVLVEIDDSLIKNGGGKNGMD